MDDDQPVRKNHKKTRTRAIPVSGWKIRFDSPPRQPEARRAESGDILALFRAWQETELEIPVIERRLNTRYAPEATRAWVGWWKKGSFRVANAEILNLSKGGALVHLDLCPPTCQPVWICLGTPHPIDFIQARVLDPKGDGEVTFMARLEFHTPCPPTFFLAAGFRTEEPPNEIDPP
jgi:hypothetical protein